MVSTMRKLPPEVHSEAIFSPCMKYRYVLSRTWGSGNGDCIFVMLNPSTADAVQDDPTVVKCRHYADAWGFGKLVVLNLFAWRSTDPKILPSLQDPVGPENDLHYEKILESAVNPQVICAWGNDGMLRNRGTAVSERLRCSRDLYCLKRNDDGSPAHPLYLNSSLRPIIFKAKI